MAIAKQPFVILGDGGLAKAVERFIRREHPNPEIRFSSDDADVRDGETVVIGLGHPNKRMILAARWGKRLWDGPLALRPHFADPSAKLGRNALIKEMAYVGHDSVIGPHTVIAPGAIICGECRIGIACFIGAGAIIVQGVELPDETYVPAGTLYRGPDDFRKPVRMVRRDGADWIEMAEVSNGVIRRPLQFRVSR